MADEVVGIEVWRVAWSVDPLAIPPIEVDRPISEEHLISYDPIDGSIT